MDLRCSGDRAANQFGRATSCLIRFAALLTLCTIGTASTQQPTATPQESGTRTRLLALQREAVGLLKRAAQADAPSEEIRRALLDASQRLQALGADPEPGSASDATGI